MPHTIAEVRAELVRAGSHRLGAEREPYCWAAASQRNALPVLAPDFDIPTISVAATVEPLDAAHPQRRGQVAMPVLARASANFTGMDLHENRHRTRLAGHAR